MKAFYWDLSRLEERSARQRLECPGCGEALSGADGEGTILHLLQHEHRPAVRRELKRRLYLWRNWEKLPEETRRLYLVSVVQQIRNDPAKFEQLQREGVVEEL